MAGKHMLSRVVAPDGVATVVRCAGSRGASGAVLIHGILHAAGIWKHQFDGLEGSDLRLAAYDVRGHGRAGKPAAPEFYQPDRLADELRSVIEASGIERPVLFGWSLGCRIAVSYLQRYGADAVSGLLICGTRLRFDPRTMTSAAAGLLGRSCSPDAAERHAARRDFLTACFAHPPATGFDALLNDAMRTPSEILRHFLGRPLEQAAFLTDPGLPLGIVHGEEDPFCPADEIAGIRELNPRAELSFYSGAGHAPFFEQPARFNEELAAFVARCRA